MTVRNLDTRIGSGLTDPEMGSGSKVKSFLRTFEFDASERSANDIDVLCPAIKCTQIIKELILLADAALNITDCDIGLLRTDASSDEDTLDYIFISGVNLGSGYARSAPLDVLGSLDISAVGKTIAELEGLDVPDLNKSYDLVIKYVTPGAADGTISVQGELIQGVPAYDHTSHVAP